MADAQFSKLKRILLDALAQPASQRQDFVARACEGDLELQREVESKLAHEHSQSTFFEPGALGRRLGVPSDTGGAAHPGALVGPYELTERIGEGTMGVVWLATQDAPLQRKLAIKIAKLSIGSKEWLLRFEAERQTLARMNHPAIARVIDAGETEWGNLYFAMEYVDGTSLTTYCESHDLDVDERLRLVCEVCEGVEHAHQKAILHRDLKPSNILVEEIDGVPHPKIIDFGIAKALSGPSALAGAETVVGHLIGTPEYMSPEQAMGVVGAVDTRSDVYSLGAILYELLTGAQPIDADTLRSADVADMRRLISEVAPPRPSQRAAENGRPAGRLRGDLDWITMRALEKDVDRRYRSARELHDDIVRHRKTEPVLAGPPTFRYRTGRLVRRNRVATAALLATVGLGLIFTVLTLQNSARLTKERDRANHEAAASERVSSFLSDMLASADPQQLGRSLRQDLTQRVTAAQDLDGSARSQFVVDDFEAALDLVNTTDAAVRLIDAEILDRAAKTIDADFGDDPEIAASLRHTLGVTYIDLGLYAEAVPQLETAVALRRRELGNDNIRTLESRHRYGEALAYVGRSFSAIPEMLDVVDARRKLLGPSDPQTLDTTLQLALSLKIRTRFEEAESLYEQARVAATEAMGDLSPAAVRARHGLGILYSIQGFHERSERILRQLRDELVAGRGEEDRATLGVSMSLGIACLDLGHYREAAELLQETLATRRRLLGSEHPNTIVTMGNLANALVGCGRIDEAEDLLKEAVANSQLHLTRGSHATVFVLGAEALFYKSIGRASEARVTLPAITDRTVTSMGPKFFATNRLLEETAEFFVGSGDIEQAREAYERLLSVLREIASEPDSGPAVRDRLAWLLLTCPLPEFRDTTAALRLAREACALTEEKSGEYLDTLGLALFANDQRAEASRVAALALERLAPEDRQRRREVERRRDIYAQAVAQDMSGREYVDRSEAEGLHRRTRGSYACHY